MPASSAAVLAAVIVCISVVGLAMGLTIPLVSLALEYRGVDSGLIGLMAAAPAFGLLFFSPLIPRLVRRLGARPALLLALAVTCAAIALLPWTERYSVWLALRVLMGATVGVLFIVSETWINQLANETNRGRLVALYATVFSLCFATGPLLINIVGSIDTARPFLIASGVLSLAAIPLLLSLGRVIDQLAQGGHEEPGAGFSVLGFIAVAPTLCAAVLLFAAIDSGSIALLPLFGLRHGFSEGLATLMASVLIAGNVALQLPLGWLADRYSRRALLAGCGLIVLVGALGLPLAVNGAVLWPLLVALGAAAGGVYTLSMVLIGQRFRGAELVTANAAVGVMFGLGSLLGPLAAGVGMRWLDPDGLPLSWALAAAGFLLLLGLRWRRHLRVAGWSPQRLL